MSITHISRSSTSAIASAVRWIAMFNAGCFVVIKPTSVMRTTIPHCSTVTSTLSTASATASGANPSVMVARGRVRRR